MSIYRGFQKWVYPQIIHFRLSITNHPFWDTSISGNPHMYYVYIYIHVYVYPEKR